MQTQTLKLFAATLFCVCLLKAQSVDDTRLKQVIVFGRDSVRASVATNAQLSAFSAQPYPDFGVDAGILTQR